ncbi:MAG: hypothetical protein JOY68_03290 [Candidatus Dormibacteraeota bacterium]|nr:hypothetical protein [Candidatus Dormibacteraeota bacterium]MBV8446269.1 hypothetical protein [Candidatus Dormibacteraeota bacterium]
MSAVISGLAFLVVLGISIAWLVTRRERYHSNVSSPGQVPTSEVVVDPETGRRQRVYMDPSSGRRSYVDEPAAPPAPRS